MKYNPRIQVKFYDVRFRDVCDPNTFRNVYWAKMSRKRLCMIYDTWQEANRYQLTFNWIEMLISVQTHSFYKFIRFISFLKINPSSSKYLLAILEAPLCHRYSWMRLLLLVKHEKMKISILNLFYFMHKKNIPCELFVYLFFY